MAVKKKTRKKRRRGRKGRKNIWGSLLIIALFLLTMAVAFIYLVLKPAVFPGRGGADRTPHYEEPTKPHLTVLNPDGVKRRPGAGPGLSPSAPKERPGIYGEDDLEQLPLVAIIIDDMGHKLRIGRGLLKLPLNLSFAFLPGAPHSRELQEKARGLGREVLLHIPMEPTDSQWDPGPLALRTGMDAATISRLFRECLRAVPGAAGINNHMGSRFTTDRPGMKTFLELVRDRGLYFVDSMTSGDSLGYFMAREMGVKSARRNVFLDNVKDRREISGQLDKLIAIAEQRGWAVGIAHPFPETLDALSSFRDKLSRRVNLVPVGRLVH